MRSGTLIACILALSVAVLAQTDRGTITGAISDPTGAAAADAKVEAKNTNTGATYNVASSATGNYTFAQLPAGTYEMTVQVPGFKKFIRENVVVQVASTVRVDVPLEVGSITESVTVSDTTSLLKTESGEVSHNFDTNRLNQLPVLTLGTNAGLGNVRNPLQVGSLMPGAVFVN